MMQLALKLALLIFLLISRPILAEDAIDRAIQELTQIQTRITTIQTNLDQAQTQHQQLLQELRETEQRIGEIAAKLREIDEEQQQQQELLTELAIYAEGQQQQLAYHRMMLARQIRASYAIGRQEQLKILLNQENPNRLSRVMTYYDYFHQAQADRISIIKETLAQLHQLQESTAKEQKQLLALQQQQQQQQQQLAQGYQQREQVLRALIAEIASDEQQLTELRQDQKQLHFLLDQLQKALIDIPLENPLAPPFRGQKGRLPWPLAGKLRHQFGDLRQQHQTEFHWDGVVITPEPNALEVQAIHYGRVAFADWFRGFGLLLILDHGDGFMSLYGYNQSLFKEVGDWVYTKEPIASVGMSGGRKHPGLYFGLRHRAQPLNPKRWCQKRDTD